MKTKLQVRPVKVKEFTIDRSKWLCGELERRGIDQGNESVLLNSSGGMCCLGFYARACGIPKPALFYEGDYSNLGFEAVKKLPSALVEVVGEEENRNTDAACALMTLNDTSKRTAPTRERLLKEKFKKLGIKVKFVGEYPAPKEQ